MRLPEWDVNSVETEFNLINKHNQKIDINLHLPTTRHTSFAWKFALRKSELYNVDAKNLKLENFALPVYTYFIRWSGWVISGEIFLCNSNQNIVNWWKSAFRIERGDFDTRSSSSANKTMWNIDFNRELWNPFTAIQIFPTSFSKGIDSSFKKIHIISNMNTILGERHFIQPTPDDE